MSDTTTIVQSERKFAESLGYLDGAGPEVRVHIHFMCDALEQQAAEIALRRGERVRLESELFDARTRMADQAEKIEALRVQVKQADDVKEPTP